MRMHELLFELKGADLPEIEKMSSSGRKDAVIKRVKDLQDNEAHDMDLLNEILQALVQGDLYDNLQAAGQEDKDIAKNLNRLTSLILYTKGSIHEKYKFTKDLQKSTRSYINISKLMTPNQTNNLMSVVEGGEFVKSLFKELLVMPPSQGIGPGELALSILSKDILSGGSSSAVHGDLKIDGIDVEVKATKQSPGRWADPRKARQDTSEMTRNIKKLALETNTKYAKSGMNLKIFMNAVNSIEDKDARKLYFYNQFKLHLNHLSDAVIKKVTKTALTGNFQNTLREYTIASYNNYKKYSGFTGMLLLKMSKNDPANWETLYFEDVEGALSNISLTNPYMSGSAQDIGLQPKIK